jgi:hypothetical protein
VSAYKPKNQTEELIIAKVKALPEIKEHFKTNKQLGADLMINLPESPPSSTPKSETYFSFQVGISNLGRFRTSYYLYVNPKNLDVYFNDYFDESGSKLITLQQWRNWRSKPGFYSNHRWKHGKLLVIKD